MPKTWYKIVIAIVIVILVILLLGFAILVFSEYFPEDTESLNIEGEKSKDLKIDETATIITYNLGYLSLDNTQDFFMDGGENVRPKNATTVTKNLAAVKSFIENQDADIFLFQEVDTNAKRSYNRFDVNSATRIALPSAYNWPVRAVMYKNCLLEQRVIIDGSDKELVVYNVHLDAYGKEEGKTEQLDILINKMKEEYDKGNYVIAGGDFNQTFPGVDTEKFPVVNTDNFVPTQMSEDYLPEDFKFVTDLERPSSRLLNEVYSGSYDNTQLYIIDGYIVSENVDVESVETIENNFSYSDHHPVKLEVRLK